MKCSSCGSSFVRFNQCVGKEDSFRFHSALAYLFTAEGQILYQCNYDGTDSANNCLLSQGVFVILAIDKVGTIGSSPPITPLSDVTSSRNSRHIDKPPVHLAPIHLLLS